MFDTAVRGQVEIRHVQGLLLRTPAELRKKLLESTRKAARPMTKEVKAEALARMPSGYGATLARAVKAETRVTGGTTIRARVKVTAPTAKSNRDVRRRNAGELWHPLFDNRVRWYMTTVAPRFVSDPIEALGRRVADGAEDAANDVADNIVRG
jgi:hypothetical protein